MRESGHTPRDTQREWPGHRRLGQRVVPPQHGACGDSRPRWGAHSLKLPALHRGTQPCLGKLEPRTNPSGFALHAAEIFSVGFIFTQIPRTQRQAGKQELKANRKKAGSLHFYF